MKSPARCQQQGMVRSVRTSLLSHCPNSLLLRLMRGCWPQSGYRTVIQAEKPTQAEVLLCVMYKPRKPHLGDGFELC